MGRRRLIGTFSGIQGDKRGRSFQNIHTVQIWKKDFDATAGT